MSSSTETILVPGGAAEWRDFAVGDYAKFAAIGSDEDTLKDLLEERKEEDFGVMLVADPTEDVPDDLVKRLAAARIPTRLRRESRDEEKPDKKAGKKDEDDKKSK